MYLTADQLSEFGKEHIILKCASCLWWKEQEAPHWRNDDSDGESPEDIVLYQGDCRRHAPRLTLADIESENNIRTGVIEEPTAALWPTTHWNEWCGDHQPGRTSMPFSSTPE